MAGATGWIQVPVREILCIPDPFQHGSGFVSILHIPSRLREGSSLQWCPAESPVEWLPQMTSTELRGQHCKLYSMEPSGTSKTSIFIHNCVSKDSNHCTFGAHVCVYVCVCVCMYACVCYTHSCLHTHVQMSMKILCSWDPNMSLMTCIVDIFQPSEVSFSLSHVVSWSLLMW